mgnify:CR=1 FL=1
MWPPSWLQVKDTIIGYLINLAHIVSTQKDFALPAVVVVELWQAFFI